MNLLDRFFRDSPVVGALSCVRKSLRKALRDAEDLPFVEDGDLKTGIEEIAHVTNPLLSHSDYFAFEKVVACEAEPTNDAQATAYARHQTLDLRVAPGEYCGMALRAFVVDQVWHRVRDDLKIHLGNVKGDEDVVLVHPERGIINGDSNGVAEVSVGRALLAAAEASGALGNLCEVIKKSVHEPKEEGYRVPRSTATALFRRAGQAEARLRQYAQG